MIKLKYPILGIYHITDMDSRKTILILPPILSIGNIKNIFPQDFPILPIPILYSAIYTLSEHIAIIY